MRSVGDYAYEPTDAERADPDKNRGYFTAALLEGLRGEAADATGRVDARLLGGFVEKRLELLTSARGGQKAEISGGNIVFRAGVERPHHRVIITLPPDFKGRVELLDGQFNLVESRDHDQGPWELQLVNMLYVLKPEDPTIEFARGGYFEVRGGAVDVRL